MYFDFIYYKKNCLAQIEKINNDLILEEKLYKKYPDLQIENIHYIKKYRASSVNQIATCFDIGYEGYQNTIICKIWIVDEEKSIFGDEFYVGYNSNSFKMNKDLHKDLVEHNVNPSLVEKIFKEIQELYGN
jgi:hypothetical protein